MATEEGKTNMQWLFNAFGVLSVNIVINASPGIGLYASHFSSNKKRLDGIERVRRTLNNQDVAFAYH